MGSRQSLFAVVEGKATAKSIVMVWKGIAGVVIGTRDS